MRSALITYVLILAAGAATQAPGQTAPALDGTWQITSMVMNGKAMDSSSSAIVLEISDNNYAQVQQGRVEERGTLIVDRSTLPMGIDFVIVEGAAAVMTQRGIVEVTNETLRLHLSRPGDEIRPDDFTPRRDQMLITAVRKFQ